MHRHLKFQDSLTLLVLAAALSGCGASGGSGDSGGGVTTPPSVTSTRMEAGIQPDSTGLHLVANSGGTSFRLVGHIYVVRADGSTAASPQPPEVITLRATNVDTGAVVFEALRMNARTFTVVQPSGSSRPGWDYVAPSNFIYSYTLGQTIRLDAVDDIGHSDDNLLDGGLEWMDTTVVPSVPKAPPIEIGTVTLLSGAG